MGFATHLGPWLLGTVKDTTGTTAGTIRNTGTTIVCQNKTINYTDTAASTAFTIPAGSLITAIQIIQTTKFTSGTTGTVTVLANGTAIAVGTISGAGSNTQITCVPTTDAQNVLLANIGTTDAIITYTTSTLTAGAGALVMAYAVRNSDGSSAPTAFQN